MDSETPLYRQVHPSWVLDDGISSQAFRPTPKDDQKLSVYDGSQFSAEESFAHFTQKNKSFGVLSVTEGEFTQEDLPCNSDNDTFQGHVLVDYSSHSKKQIEKKAKKLRDIALRRDWQYQNPDNEQSDASSEMNEEVPS